LFPTSWTPDGRFVIAAKWEGGRASIVLIAAAAETGEAESKLKPLISSNGNAVIARVSPDGRWVAWDSDETGRQEAYVASFGREGTVGLPALVSRGGGGDAAWAADGRTLYYASSDHRLMAAAFDPAAGVAAAPKPLYDFAPAQMLRREQASTLAILPDGRVLGIRKGDDESEIRRLDLIFNWAQAVDKR
jgi:hypothetical protein